jgi:hypothetical protein
MSKEFDDMHRYIYELEGKLGLAPSSEPAPDADGARAGDVRDPAP